MTTTDTTATTNDPHRPTPMSADQLLEMLRLSQSSDSVELKLTVPDADRRATVKALEIDPLGARLRQIVFFDTPELTLNHHGVVVRARRTQGKGDDSVVKLRPVVPTELPSKLRKEDDFKVEVDAMPGGFVCSGSYKGTLGAGRGEAGARRAPADQHALQQATASVLRRARSGGDRPG